MWLLSSVYERLHLKKQVTKRTHQYWVHNILQKRSEHGAYYHLERELQLDYGLKFV